LFYQQADFERSAQRLADAFASQQTDVAELFEETLEGLTRRLTAAQRREGRGSRATRQPQAAAAKVKNCVCIARELR
jgi:hypothetical protein